MKRALTAGWLALIPASAIAHHSFDGAFDRNQVVHLEGTVTQYVLGAPHSYLKLSVTNGDGSTTEWHVETTMGQRLQQVGWTPESFMPGEAVSVDGWPAHEGRPYLRIKSMKRADGTAVAMWPPASPNS